MDADLLPVLVHIQSRLDSDLRIATIAREAGWSESSLNRRLNAATGQTPGRYVERLRLERAAVRLVLTDSKVVDIALDNGFASHEVFTRAFRRHFGIAPKEWRARHHAGDLGQDGREPGLSEATTSISLSSTRLTKLRPLRVAFLRHTGPYDQVPAELFPSVLERLQALGRVPRGLPLGIAHDPPGITPPERLRFDACWTIDEPLPTESGLGTQTLPSGSHATTTFVGPFSRIGGAYEAIVSRLLASPDDVELVAGPSVEWYRSGSVDAKSHLNQVDISLPVRPRSGGRRVFR